MAPIARAVTVSLEDLKSGNVSFETLQEAFGPDSLGILVVKNLPAEFNELRHSALSYASYLGNLPGKELAKLENPVSKYLTGWSLGKETLKNGQVDTHKGSFYANCAFYVSPSLLCAEPTTEFNPHNFPEYLTANEWPSASVLPGFKDTLESLCRMVIDVAALVAGTCDRFAEKEIQGYPTGGYLTHMVKTSSTTKARLLHYYPQEVKGDDATTTTTTNGSGMEKDKDEDEDDWCATHLDHGCLTGLTSAMFIDESANPPKVPAEGISGTARLLPPLPELDASPDPRAGLYIKSRSAETVQVRIPRDCLAFQTGETLERITEGKFKAVPHFVRGSRPEASGVGRKIARNTLAVFTQPNLGETVDIRAGLNFGEFARGIVAKNTVS